MIADHYARISNQYKPLEKSDIPQEYSEPKSAPPYVAPHVVNRMIKSMNKKSSTFS